MTYKLSPSDFAFLYEGCKRCFYLKVVHGIRQPSVPLPSIFSKIAGLLYSHFSEKRTEALHPRLPPGIVKWGEKRVESRIIERPGHHATCVIRGRFDVVVEFDDNTYGIIDFKTGNPNEQYHALYSRQLNAYAYALEHPGINSLDLSPISHLGLLYFYPSKLSQEKVGWLSYDAEAHWIPMKKDEDEFLAFVDEVLSYLESPTPPDPSPGCNWCNYLTELRAKGIM